MRPIPDVQAQRKVMVSLDDSDTSKKALEVGSQGPPACLCYPAHSWLCPALPGADCTANEQSKHLLQLPVVRLPHCSGR